MVLMDLLLTSSLSTRVCPVGKTLPVNAYAWTAGFLGQGWGRRKKTKPVTLLPIAPHSWRETSVESRRRGARGTVE